MSLPVTFENESLRIEVYPHLGGKVSSIFDKADKFELLFDYAAEIPTRSQYDRPYSNGWYAGWDECFPAVAAGPYPGHPYDGVGVPDHGEIWGLPTIAEPTRNGITTTWHGLRFGYRLTRTLELDGPTLLARYALQNLAPFDFRFVWAQHALMSLASPVQINLTGREKRWRIDHDAQDRDLQTLFTWPDTPDGEDLSRPHQLGGKRAWKIFAVDPIAAPATITYPERGRSLRVEFSSEDGTKAYWGVWLNAGGWGGHRHFALEPTTGRHDDLSRAGRDGSAGQVEPSGKREWAVRWTLG